ncbi:hypothetical protein GCM10009854_12070 [Saccharopolyspora halophila]|uniref:Uncharacterized protein n=1 Tax=Saccharopolyspora halophila TaxID=405551 RepID=A0ABN3FTZ4_9PSEU
MGMAADPARNDPLPRSQVRRRRRLRRAPRSSRHEPKIGEDRGVEGSLSDLWWGRAQENCKALN